MKLPSGWRRRGRGIYWRHYVEGRRVETYLGTTLPAAHRAFAELIRDKGVPIHTVGDLLHHYLRAEVAKKSEATKDMAGRAVATLLPVFGTLTLNEITPTILYGYYERRSRKASARQEIGVLRHAFSCAVKWGHLRTNHLLGQIRLPKARPRQRYVTDDELRAFLKVCTPWMAAYVGLKLLTGLPQEDLLSLTRQDVREDGLHARRRKTGARPKVYPWDDEGALLAALEAVSAAHKKRVGSAYLFHNYKGQPYYTLDAKGHRARKPYAFISAWQRDMAKFIEEGGVRFTEHDLRAKVASDAEAEHAQALMDHATRRTTEEIYRRAPRRVPIGRGPKVVQSTDSVPPEAPSQS